MEEDSSVDCIDKIVVVMYGTICIAQQHVAFSDCSSLLPEISGFTRTEYCKLLFEDSVPVGD